MNRKDAAGPIWPLQCIQGTKGALQGCLLTSLVLIVNELRMSMAEFGIGLLGMEGGYIAGVVMSWLAVRRSWASVRQLIAVGGMILALGTALPGVATSELWLSLALAVWALGQGLQAHSLTLETAGRRRVIERELLGPLQGVAAIARMGSVAMTAGAIVVGLSATAYLAAVGASGLIVTLVASRRLLRTAPLGSDRGERTAHAFRRWRWMLGLSALAIAAYALIEAVWHRWHGVYLTGPDIAAPTAVAVFAYGAYATAATASQFGHPMLVKRWAERVRRREGAEESTAVAWARFKTVWVGIAASLCGAALVVMAGSPAIGVLGSGALGLGAATVGTLAVASAGEDSSAVALIHGAVNVVVFATPVPIGLIADALTLRWALIGALVGGAAIMAPLSLVIKPRASSRHA